MENWKPRGQVFCSRQHLTIIRTVHTRPRSQWPRSLNRKTREMQGSACSSRSKKICKIHHQYPKTTSTEAWLHYLTGALSPRMLTWPLHLRREHHQFSSEVWDSMTRQICTSSMRSKMKSSIETPLNLTCQQSITKHTKKEHLPCEMWTLRHLLKRLIVEMHPWLWLHRSKKRTWYWQLLRMARAIKIRWIPGATMSWWTSTPSTSSYSGRESCWMRHQSLHLFAGRSLINGDLSPSS